MSPKSTEDLPDDETLVAFADGRLDSAEAEKVAQYLRQNEDARLFVERLVTSANLVRAAFEEAVATPADDKLAALILQSGQQPGREAGLSTDAITAGNVIPMPQRSRPTSSGARFALPLAAALALVVGSVAGYEFGRRGAETGGDGMFGVAIGPIGKTSPVSRLLESRGSGDIVPIAANASRDTRHLMVVASFRDRAGRVCREFEVLTNRDEAVPETAAIACRHGDSAWHIEGAAQVSSAPPIPEKDFSPAGSDSVSPIEGILAALGAKPALSKADEEALRRNGWK